MFAKGNKVQVIDSGRWWTGKVREVHGKLVYCNWLESFANKTEWNQKGYSPWKFRLFDQSVSPKKPRSSATTAKKELSKRIVKVI